MKTALLLLTLVVVMQSPAPAQSVNARENRIVGVWDVQVTVRNCSNGGALTSFRGLHKYELGGTGQVVPATNPAALSPHVSVWKSVEKDVYQMSFKMFRFDAAGNNIGWIVVRNDVAITEDGNGYAGLGRAETFDSNGNFVGASCPTFIGTRFQ
ncbi:MAG: hypothetical protein ACXWC8_21270 [Limisphaerales bacterium]